MKNKYIPHCTTVPKYNRKIVETSKIDTIANIHDRSLYLLGTGTYMKSGGVKQVLWTKPSLRVLFYIYLFDIEVVTCMILVELMALTIN